MCDIFPRSLFNQLACCYDFKYFWRSREKLCTSLLSVFCFSFFFFSFLIHSNSQIPPYSPYFHSRVKPINTRHISNVFRSDALEKNQDLEFERNKERFAFLKVFSCHFCHYSLPY
jgi:hypothetical protein